MGDLKAIGSEKLTGQDKINRIMEIARYGESTKNSELHTSTNSFTKRAADGNIYAIVHEKDGYYVKSGLNESSLDYVNGFTNKKRNRYKSYSAALKRLNLMLKPINEEYNNGYGDSMFEQEEEKIVMKKKQAPKPPAAPAPAPAPAPAAPGAAPTPPAAPAPGAAPAPAPGAAPTPFPMGDEDMDVDVDMEMGDEDMDVDVDMEGGDDFDAEEERPTIKSIQKLTGKLGQKMREFEDEVDSDMIKYVLNSIISAVDLDLLDEEDRDDIISRLEPELEDEYGVEDEFDVNVDVEDDMDISDEELDDMGMEDDLADPTMGLEESLKNRVNKTLKKYFKSSKLEKGKKLFQESASRSYVKGQVNISNSKPIPVALSETIEQELMAKKVLKENKNIKFIEKTKNGTLIFKGRKNRMGVTKKGEILR